MISCVCQINSMQYQLHHICYKILQLPCCIQLCRYVYFLTIIQLHVYSYNQPLGDHANIMTCNPLNACRDIFFQDLSFSLLQLERTVSYMCTYIVNACTHICEKREGQGAYVGWPSLKPGTDWTEFDFACSSLQL